MEIISFRFAILAIASVIIFYLLNHKYRIGYLTILSCGFIATYNYYLLIYVVAYALFNYLIGINIPDSKFKIALFRTGVVINLSQLIVLKYASFAIDPIFQILNSKIYIAKLSEIIIPFGISFFTLQGIGYLINVKMGWEKPERKFLNFLLYITFYPKFLSGPIERSNHFLPQLKVIQSFNEKQISDGLRIALFGFFKKIAIANQLAPFISSSYANLNSADGFSLWIVLLLQPLYLYFDFSGYTDIAIGFAKTFGIELLPNFDRPFFSQNMTTFWKRFHISLSSWFNDYVFRQTSFRRRKWGIYASIYALLVTWTLFGIWHGAGWNFMLLGLVQALAIIYEFFTKKWRVSLFSKLNDNSRNWLGRMFTYLFYGTSLVFFFSPDTNSTFIFFSKLFKSSASIQSVLARAMREIPLSAIILIIVFLLIELINNDFKDIFIKLEHFWSTEKKKNEIFRWVIYSSVLAILFVLGSQVKQFIYAQF
jgi:D-alanyl-lipoteichoic acid acyltransferase DltB (MBOAT superfamily)